MISGTAAEQVDPRREASEVSHAIVEASGGTFRGRFANAGLGFRPRARTGAHDAARVVGTGKPQQNG